jgi:hypothetical protein
MEFVNRFFAPHSLHTPLLVRPCAAAITQW